MKQQLYSNVMREFNLILPVKVCGRSYAYPALNLFFFSLYQHASLSGTNIAL